MSEPTIRDGILHYLARHHSGNARELSQALLTTEQNIRYHLKHLVGAGLVQRLGGPRSFDHGSGRKRMLFVLTHHAYGSNYETLTGILLVFIKEKLPQEDTDPFLEFVVKQLYPRGYAQTLWVERLNGAVQQLNQYHYQAHWEAHQEGPLVFLHHCPFANLVPLHPEFCRLDCLALEHLTGAPFQLKARRSETGSPAFCLLAPL